MSVSSSKFRKPRPAGPAAACGHLARDRPGRPADVPIAGPAGRDGT